MNSGLPGLGRLYDETKRISRILELTQTITAHPRRYLRRDLADRFGVGERMIQKDLDIIRNGLKLPLLHAAKGYYFEEMPRLPALQYTFSEALALLLAVQAARQVSGIGSTDLAAATARLESLFPSEFAPLLRRVSAQGGINTQHDHRQQMLILLNLSLAGGRKVRMRYKTSSRGGEISERVIRPYHIMPYVRSWQLIAYCELRSEVRMFKVDRIEEAALTDEYYLIPEDFNVDDYIGMAWGVIRKGANEPVDVVLYFNPEAGRWVTEEFWHKSQRAEPQDDGSVIFRLHVAITPEFVNWILYYGARVEVLEPEYLRETIGEEHRKAAELNKNS